MVEMKDTKVGVSNCSSRLTSGKNHYAFVYKIKVNIRVRISIIIPAVVFLKTLDVVRNF